MNEVLEQTAQGWKPPNMTRLKLYRIGSNGTYRMKDLPFGSSTVTVNYLKEFMDGYITEPAFKRIQEATGITFVQEGAVVSPAALQAIALRTPELAGAYVTPSAAEPKRRGRKPKAKGGE